MVAAKTDDRWFDVEDQGKAYKWDLNLHEESSFDAPEKLGSLLEDIAYTESRMNEDVHASRFVFALAGWPDRIASVKRQYDKTWWAAQGETGRLRAAEAALNDVGHDMLLFFHDANLKETPRAQRYLQGTPWHFAQLERSQDVPALRSMIDMLAAEPEAELRAISQRYKAALSKGLAALERYNQAQAQLNAARRAVDEISSKIFALFHRIESKLIDYAEENELPHDWYYGFTHR